VTVSAAELHRRPVAAAVPVDAACLQAVAELRVPPDRARGRAAVIDVPETWIDGFPVRGVKLKGVGVAPLAAVGAGRLLPPSAVSYFETGATRWLDVDVDPQGRLLTCPASDRPFGSLLLARARNEDAMLDEVRRAGLPAPLPLGYGELRGLRFHGERTGFVIIGLADPDDRRVGQEAADREAAALTRLGDRQATQAFIDWLATTARRVAALQRRLHAAGFVHNGPHLGNFSTDHEGGIVLHDLDALRTVDERTSQMTLLGTRLRDYYVLAASVGRRAYAPPWRAHRRELLRAVGDGYFGPDAAPELDRLQPFDHLRFWEVLQRCGHLRELPGPLLRLMRDAIQTDSVRLMTNAAATDSERCELCGEVWASLTALRMHRLGRGSATRLPADAGGRPCQTP